MCTSAIFGQRVGEGLQSLLHRLDPSKPAPALRPIVCFTSPLVAVEAGRDRTVTYYGYDFTAYAKASTFRAYVSYDGDALAMADVGHVSVTTSYQLTLDIQAVDFTAMDRARPQARSRVG